MQLFQQMIRSDEETTCVPLPLPLHLYISLSLSLSLSIYPSVSRSLCLSDYNFSQRLGNRTVTMETWRLVGPDSVFLQSARPEPAQDLDVVSEISLASDDRTLVQPQYYHPGGMFRCQ